MSDTFPGDRSPRHALVRFRASSSAIRRLFLTLTLGMLLAGGCTGPHHALVGSPPGYVSQVPVGYPTHLVRPQETLWSISKAYGVSSCDLLRANHLTDPTRVPVGQLLIIPPAPTLRVNVPLYANPRWTYIVVHHSATPAGNARIFDKSHRKRGFINGLGYHFLIDNGTSGRKDGQLEIGSRWWRQLEGAHCNADNMNYRAIGICLVGDFSTHGPSQAQLDSLAALVTRLARYYHIPKSQIIRHRDVAGKNTQCPGNRFPWDEFQARLPESLS